MRLSFVLHLVPDEAARGRLVGDVEAVASGARSPIRSVDELVSFCRDSVASPGGGLRLVAESDRTPHPAGSCFLPERTQQQ